MSSLARQPPHLSSDAERFRADVSQGQLVCRTTTMDILSRSVGGSPARRDRLWPWHRRRKLVIAGRERPVQQPSHSLFAKSEKKKRGDRRVMARSESCGREGQNEGRNSRSSSSSALRARCWESGHSNTIIDDARVFDRCWEVRVGGCRRRKCLDTTQGAAYSLSRLFQFGLSSRKLYSLP